MVRKETLQTSRRTMPRSLWSLVWWRRCPLRRPARIFRKFYNSKSDHRITYIRNYNYILGHRRAAAPRISDTPYIEHLPTCYGRISHVVNKSKSDLCRVLRRSRVVWRIYLLFPNTTRSHSAVAPSRRHPTGHRPTRGTVKISTGSPKPAPSPALVPGAQPQAALALATKRCTLRPHRHSW